MKTIVDLHIHSKYARATSKNLDLHEIAKWSDIKGVDIVSCADFTHPAWFKHLENNLEEINDSGLYKLKGSKTKTKFLVATEISCIYSHAGRTRRVHLCIVVPNLSAANRINTALADAGAKLAADGRPILGMSSKRVLQICLEADPKTMLIPAHVWTPWFAVFGSKSGYDTLKECFEDLTPHIKALETGLSSDPLMNWRLSQLENMTLVSNSDAHSGPKIGREANVFDMKEFSFNEIKDIIESGDKKRFLYTIEFYPEEGMYHIDGHRECKFSCEPSETSKKHRGICPVCKKPLTIGVLNQVDKLADIKIEDVKREKYIPYKSIVPLPEIIASFYGVAAGSKKVEKAYFDIIAKSKNEFDVLLDLSAEELRKIMDSDLAEGILRMRTGNIHIQPGFDGQYGKVEVFTEKERKNIRERQVKLF